MDEAYKLSDDVDAVAEGEELTPDTDEAEGEVEGNTDSIDASDTPDYEAIIAADVSELSREFPELKGLKDITELNNPLRYAALRDLGLTPREAYLATAKRPAQDTRAHLRSAHGRSAAASVGMMSQEELSAARELFPSLSDSQLQKLYKKVTK